MQTLIPNWKTYKNRIEEEDADLLRLILPFVI